MSELKTVGEVYMVYVGLVQLDQQLEKVAPEIRLRIGINMNKMRPTAEVFERTQSRTVADISEAGETNTARVQYSINEAIFKLRSEECSIEVRTFKETDLNLSENPKVSADTLSKIMSVLELE